jgi:branched-chain amino acid transport system ATP-binding protein
MGAAPLLAVESIVVRFGGISALDEVSLSLNEGCCALIGPNGAGKTTLLDVLSGLRRPQEGRILLDGHDVTRRSSTWMAQSGVRRTFQRHQAFGWLTVEENLLVALEWRSRSRRVIADLFATPATRRRRTELTARVDEVAHLCGLESLRRRRAGTLPIGQLRQMEFARAIIDRPRLLLLDEPTSGLGIEETAQLADTIRDVVRNDACAVLLVEHDLDFVTGVSDRLVVLQLGAVIADGDPQVVSRDQRVVEAYIGVN